MAKRSCPKCGGTKAAVALTEQRPVRDGDYGVCGGCASVLRVTGEDAQPVLATPEEIDNLSTKQLVLIAAAKARVIREKIMEWAKVN